MLSLAACTQPANVTYSIHNGSTTPITVEYYKFEDNDTQTVSFGADTLVTILETANTSGSSNWFYDYKMHINTIYNAGGDTIVINPNISQYWYLYVGAPNYQYKLDVTDTSF